MCLGPYNAQSNINGVKTEDIFEQISDIANACYQSTFNEPAIVNTAESRMALQVLKENRMRSTVLNNQAVQQFLNLIDIKSEFILNQKLEYITKSLDEACQLSPINQVALLNKHLLAWKCGKIRDDEF